MGQRHARAARRQHARVSRQCGTRGGERTRCALPVCDGRRGQGVRADAVTNAEPDPDADSGAYACADTSADIKREVYTHFVQEKRTARNDTAY